MISGRPLRPGRRLRVVAVLALTMVTACNRGTGMGNTSSKSLVYHAPAGQSYVPPQFRKRSRGIRLTQQMLARMHKPTVNFTKGTLADATDVNRHAPPKHRVYPGHMGTLPNGKHVFFMTPRPQPTISAQPTKGTNS